MYLNTLGIFILLAIHRFYGKELFYFQQDDASPHHHQNIGCCLDETLPGQCIEQKGSVDYPPHSPDITLFDFTFGGP
jgi:hypothetical protein